MFDEIIFEGIRKATYYAPAKTKEFVEFINKKSSSENRRELTAKTNELGKLEKRNAELDAWFKRLYEDNILGKITNEQFRMLSVGYNAEQSEIQEQIPKLQAESLYSLSSDSRTRLQMVPNIGVADRHLLPLYRQVNRRANKTSSIKGKDGQPKLSVLLGNTALR